MLNPVGLAGVAPHRTGLARHIEVDAIRSVQVGIHLPSLVVVAGFHGDCTLRDRRRHSGNESKLMGATSCASTTTH